MAKITRSPVELPEKGLDLADTLRAIERDLIRQAIERSRTQDEAAKLLRLNRVTFWSKLRKFKFPRVYASSKLST